MHLIGAVVLPMRLLLEAEDPGDTRPMPDAVACSSAQLPTEHFNARFSKESLTFWLPLLGNV